MNSSHLRLILLVSFFVFIVTQDCKEGCSTCSTSKETCYSCADPSLSKFTDGHCEHATLPIDNCHVYLFDGICSKCVPGSSLNYDGLCVLSDSGCLEFKPNTSPPVCVRCGFGKTLKNGSCTGVMNCIQYDEQSKVCNECDDGFFSFDDQLCVADSCETTDSTLGGCLTCPKDYFLNSYHCISNKFINLTVNNCLVINRKGECKYCIDDYVLKNSSCTLNKPPTKPPVPPTPTTNSTKPPTVTPPSVVVTTSSNFSFNGNGQTPPPTSNTQPTKQPPTTTTTPTAAPLPANCQAADPSNSKLCATCVQGFSLQPNKSCLATPTPTSSNNDPNCVRFAPNGICLLCATGYVKKDKCTKIPAECLDANPSTGACGNCTQGYSLDKGFVCNPVISADPNCIWYKDQICQACVQGNTNLQNGRCVAKVSDYCVVPDASAGVCRQCLEGLVVLNDSMCVDPGCAQQVDGFCPQCANGYVFTDYLCVQVPTIPNCAVTTTPGTCSKCNDRFYLANNSCIAVDQRCNTYNSANGNCTTCKPTFKMLAGFCVDTNCLSLAGRGICGRCAKSFYLQSQKCIKIPVENCEAYDTKCTKCAPKFVLGAGKCIQQDPWCANFDSQVGKCKTCKAGYQLISDVCGPANCMTFVAPACQQCYGGYYLNNQNLCEPIPEPNCANYTSGQCVGCSPGYRLTSMAQCPSLIVNCTTYADNSAECKACVSGYWSNGQTCLQNPPNCLDVDRTNGLCSKCATGFTLNRGACIKSTPSPTNPPVTPSNASNSTGSSGTSTNNTTNVNRLDPNCRFSNLDKTCRMCSNRYYLIPTGLCAPVSTLCGTYDNTTGACLTCYQGYTLAAGVCITAEVTLDPNCKTYQKGECTVCSVGYFKKDGKCVAASPLCKTFDPETGACLTCYPGYVVSNSTCLMASRVPSSQTCLSYSLTNPQLCLTCATGYTLSNGQCMSTTSNCKTLKNNSCVECTGGYTLVNGLCVGQSPLCKTVDKTTGICIACYQGYTLSKGTCILSSTLDPNCVKRNATSCTQCADRYFLQPNNVCTPVNKNCATFNNMTGQCTSCTAPLQLVNADCVPKKSDDPYCQTSDLTGKCVRCQSGFYLNSQNNNRCTEISILCSNFDYSRQVCVECRAGYFLQDNSCIYPSMGLDEFCIRYEGSYCSTCAQGYYLFNYICSAVDPDCVSFNYENSVCEACGNGQPSGPFCYPY